MVTITGTATKEKIFQDEILERIELRITLVFGDLSVNNRKVLGLPLTKLNPNYDQNDVYPPNAQPRDIAIIDERNPRIIPMTNLDTTESITFTESIPPITGLANINAKRDERVARLIKIYRDKLRAERREALS